MFLLTLKDSRKCEIRPLLPDDHRLLYRYLTDLSAESKSRFGPHPFDPDTISHICANLPGEIMRYVAMDRVTGEIVGYMLFCPGLLDFDEKRYTQYGIKFDQATTVTFAPSVADGWQSTGLGTSMYCLIESELREAGINQIVLWGGVQATNAKAIAFYKKLGYEYVSSFRHDGKDNHDMYKKLK